MWTRSMGTTLVAGVVVLCMGEQGKGRTAQMGDEAAAGAEGVGAQAGATISGKVKFTGARPVMAKIDMSDEPVCKGKYQAPPTKEDVVVSANGMLANVFVYVKAGLPATYKAPAAPAPVVLDQDGCRYKPHVFGILVGQTMSIKNSDGIAHNIKAKGVKNRPFNISQPTTMTTPRTFTAPEVMVALECNVHGWMKAYAAVLPHTFSAVSRADGSFKISGLPPGTYTREWDATEQPSGVYFYQLQAGEFMETKKLVLLR